MLEQETASCLTSPDPAPAGLHTVASRELETNRWPLADGVISFQGTATAEFVVAIEYKRVNESIHGILTALGQALAYIEKGYSAAAIVIPATYPTHASPGAFLDAVIQRNKPGTRRSGSLCTKIPIPPTRPLSSAGSSVRGGSRWAPPQPRARPRHAVQRHSGHTCEGVDDPGRDLQVPANCQTVRFRGPSRARRNHCVSPCRRDRCRTKRHLGAMAFVHLRRQPAEPSLARVLVPLACHPRGARPMGTRRHNLQCSVRTRGWNVTTAPACSGGSAEGLTPSRTSSLSSSMRGL